MHSMTSAELEKIHAEISKLIAETGKLNAENRKMSLWYPLAVATGLIGAVATLTTLLLKLV
jgi:hypothetical protein